MALGLQLNRRVLAYYALGSVLQHPQSKQDRETMCQVLQKDGEYTFERLQNIITNRSP